MTDANSPVQGTPLIAPSSTDHPLYDDIVAACQSIYDPEIPVNIYDLGLIYTIDIKEDNAVNVTMTLTAPAVRWRAKCPVGSPMPLNRFPVSNTSMSK
jgi:metal-sulfur cluster biosynthetic enzyme